MLENSYDASGIKFGIIVSPMLPNFSDELCSEKVEQRSAAIEKICKYGEVVMIDFSNIDGLTTTEVVNICPNMQAKNVVIFVVYNSMDINKQEGGKETHVGLADWIPIIINDATRDVEIDELMVEHYLNNYNKLSYINKRRARCFLQRYKYGTKERTDEILKEKVYKKEEKK